jgi:membrane-bound metal-dependent hydrolase YbcI (DUF457 family)
MTYKGHTVGGVLAAVAVVRVLPVTRLTFVLTVLAAMFGGLAPDLDAPGAYLSRRLGPLHWGMTALLSNPITWWCIGYPMARHIEATVSRRTPWFVEWPTWPGLRWFFGDQRAGRAVERLAVGRAVVNKLMGHRALSHTIVGWALACAAWALLWGGTVYCLQHYSPDSLAQVWRDDQHVFGVPPATLRGAVPPAAWPLLSTTAGFAVGYVSHLLLDMTTVSGVPLFLPWTLRRCFLLPPALRIHSS